MRSLTSLSSIMCYPLEGHLLFCGSSRSASTATEPQMTLNRINSSMFESSLVRRLKVLCVLCVLSVMSKSCL